MSAVGNCDGGTSAGVTKGTENTILDHHGGIHALWAGSAAWRGHANNDWGRREQGQGDSE